MDHGEARIFMVDEPVVDAIDPFDADGRTADIPWTGKPEPVTTPFRDVLVAGPGQGAWFRRFGAVLVRDWAVLLPVMLLAAIPMHFFVGRLDDTVVAAPALSDLAGGFGLLLLPAMWLAFLAVSALPLVLSLAGAVGVAVPMAAEGRPPRPGRVWALVAQRLRALWLWFAGFGLLIGGMPLLLAEARIGTAAAGPVTVLLALVSTGVLTVGGLLGCVVLIERGHRPRRAVHLLSQARPVGLVVTAAAVTVVPGVVDGLFGAVASTLIAVVLVQLWAIAALVTYAQARRLDEPVTSAYLRDELSRAEA